MAGIGVGIDIVIRGRGDAAQKINGVTRSAKGLTSQFGRFAAGANKTVSALRRITTASTRMGKSMRSSSARVSEGATKLAGLATLGAAPLILGMKTAIKEAANLESAMTGVAQKAQNLSTGEIESLRLKFLKLSADVPETAVALAEMGKIAAQTGVKTEDGILQVASASSRLARLSNLSGTEATESLARMTEQFRIGGNVSDGLKQKAVQLASSMNFLAASTATTEKAIADATIRAGGMARNIGLSAAETQALAAAMLGAGVKTQVTGSTLNKLFVGIQSKTKAFADLVGTDVESFTAKFRDDAPSAIMDVLQAFERLAGGVKGDDLAKLAAGGDEIAQKMLDSGVGIGEFSKALNDTGLGGVRAIQGIAGLITKMETLAGPSGLIAGASRELANTDVSKSFLNIAFAKELDDINAQFALMSGTVSNTMGEIANQAFKTSILAISQFVRDLSTRILGLSDSAKKAIGFAVGFTAALLATTGATMALVAGFAFLVSGLAAVGAPLLLLLPIIAAVVAGGALIAANFGKFSKAIGIMFERAKPVFEGLVAAIGEVFAEFLTLEAKVTGTGDKLGIFGRLAVGAFEMALVPLQALAAWVRANKSEIVGLFQRVTQAARDFGNWIQAIVLRIREIAVETQFLDRVKAAFAKVAESARNLWFNFTGALTTIREVFTGVGTESEGAMGKVLTFENAVVLGMKGVVVVIESVAWAFDKVSVLVRFVAESYRGLVDAVATGGAVVLGWITKIGDAFTWVGDRARDVKRFLFGSSLLHIAEDVQENTLPALSAMGQGFLDVGKAAAKAKVRGAEFSNLATAIPELKDAITKTPIAVRVILEADDLSLAPVNLEAIAGPAPFLGAVGPPSPPPILTGGTPSAPQMGPPASLALSAPQMGPPASLAPPPTSPDAGAPAPALAPAAPAASPMPSGGGRRESTTMTAQVPIVVQIGEEIILQVVRRVMLESDYRRGGGDTRSPHRGQGVR